MPRPYTAYALRKWPANCLLTVFKPPLQRLAGFHLEILSGGGGGGAKAAITEVSGGNNKLSNVESCVCMTSKVTSENWHY